MKLPTLKQFLSEGRRVWNLVSPNLRKITYHVHLENSGYDKTLKGWEKFLTDYWNQCKKNPSKFGYDIQTVMPVIEEGYKRVSQGEKNHQKAMKIVEEKDEE